LLIDYRDNGKGLDDVGIHNGMGMNNIISRLQMLGASWEVHSEKKNGYHFIITLPAEI
jgi:signal transduction histidine kinase